MAHFLTLFLLLFFSFLPLTPERLRCAATGTEALEIRTGRASPMAPWIQTLEGNGYPMGKSRAREK